MLRRQVLHTIIPSSRIQKTTLPFIMMTILNHHESKRLMVTNTASSSSSFEIGNNLQQPNEDNFLLKHFEEEEELEQKVVNENDFENEDEDEVVPAEDLINTTQVPKVQMHLSSKYSNNNQQQQQSSSFDLPPCPNRPKNVRVHIELDQQQQRQNNNNINFNTENHKERNSKNQENISKQYLVTLTLTQPAIPAAAINNNNNNSGFMMNPQSYYQEKDRKKFFELCLDIVALGGRKALQKQQVKQQDASNNINSDDAKNLLPSTASSALAAQQQKENTSSVTTSKLSEDELLLLNLEEGANVGNDVAVNDDENNSSENGNTSLAPKVTTCTFRLSEYMLPHLQRLWFSGVLTSRKANLIRWKWRRVGGLSEATSAAESKSNINTPVQLNNLIFTRSIPFSQHHFMLILSTSLAGVHHSASIISSSSARSENEKDIEAKKDSSSLMSGGGNNNNKDVNSSSSSLPFASSPLLSSLHTELRCMGGWLNPRQSQALNEKCNIQNNNNNNPQHQNLHQPDHVSECWMFPHECKELISQWCLFGFSSFKERNSHLTDAMWRRRAVLMPASLPSSSSSSSSSSLSSSSSPPSSSALPTLTTFRTSALLPPQIGMNSVSPFAMNFFPKKSSMASLPMLHSSPITQALLLLGGELKRKVTVLVPPSLNDRNNKKVTKNRKNDEQQQQQEEDPWTSPENLTSDLNAKTEAPPAAAGIAPASSSKIKEKVAREVPAAWTFPFEVSNNVIAWNPWIKKRVAACQNQDSSSSNVSLPDSLLTNSANLVLIHHHQNNNNNENIFPSVSISNVTSGEDVIVSVVTNSQIKTRIPADYFDLTLSKLGGDKIINDQQMQQHQEQSQSVQLWSFPAEVLPVLENWIVADACSWSVQWIRDCLEMKTTIIPVSKKVTKNNNDDDESIKDNNDNQTVSVAVVAKYDSARQILTSHTNLIRDFVAMGGIFSSSSSSSSSSKKSKKHSSNENNEENKNSNNPVVSWKFQGVGADYITSYLNNNNTRSLRLPDKCKRRRFLIDSQLLADGLRGSSFVADGHFVVRVRTKFPVVTKQVFGTQLGGTNIIAAASPGDDAENNNKKPSTTSGDEKDNKARKPYFVPADSSFASCWKYSRDDVNRRLAVEAFCGMKSRFSAENNSGNNNSNNQELNNNNNNNNNNNSTNVSIPTSVIDQAFIDPSSKNNSNNNILDIVPNHLFLRRLKNFTLLITTTREINNRDHINNNNNLMIPYWVSIFRLGGKLLALPITNLPHHHQNGSSSTSMMMMNSAPSSFVLGWTVSSRRWVNLLEWSGRIIERHQQQQQQNATTTTTEATNNNNNALPLLLTSPSTLEAAKHLPRAEYLRFVPIADMSRQVLPQSTFYFDGISKNRIPVVAGFDEEKLKSVKLCHVIDVIETNSSGFFSLRFKSDLELEEILGVKRCPESFSASNLQFQPRLPWLKWAKCFAPTFNRLGGKFGVSSSSSSHHHNNNNNNFDVMCATKENKLDQLQSREWVFPSCVKSLVVDEYLNKMNWILEVAKKF